jgi:outer membrane protein with beta-barrel domain
MPVALLGLTLLTSTLFAQEKKSKGEVFGGYQFARFSDGIAVKDLNSNGWDAGFAYYFSRWLGAEADFSGTYATDDTSSGLPFRVTNYTYTFGPVISPRNSSRFAPFGQFLFGGYHETLAGYTNSDSGFAMLAGGGLDVHLRANLSLRGAEVDWLHPPNSAIFLRRTMCEL